MGTDSVDTPGQNTPQRRVDLARIWHTVMCDHGAYR